MDEDAIIAALRACYLADPAGAPLGQPGPKGDLPTVPCSQLALLGTPEGEYLLGIGIGTLALHVPVPLDQLRLLHANLSALLSQSRPHGTRQ